ncbi:MAG: hypothetical protein ACPGGK_08010, partial [Pikeienuella sp.]
MNRKRLILHIGMHKTGSTTIQRFFARNRWLLRRLGICYPESRGIDGRLLPKHNAIFSAISHQADKGEVHPQLGPVADLVMDAADQINRSPGRVGVISAEGFSGERPVFARALAPLASEFDVSVVILLRRRDLWVESFYKQMVLNQDVREARPFAEFLSAPSTVRHMNYLRILSWWSDAFGPEAINVGVFEPDRSTETLVRQFLKLADLPLQLSLLPYATGHTNPSLSAEAASLIRFANSKGMVLPKDVKSRLEVTLPEQSPYFFTLAQRLALNSRYQADDEGILNTFLDPD